MNLLEEIEKVKLEGYSEANAQARVCQDIILYGISKGRLSQNVTVKGGVVMRNIYQNARRATQDIEQEEYCFDICFQEDGASLLMNSREQIITEKLKSFLRFGTRSTRYKDVFDICYLSESVDREKLLRYMCVDMLR